MAQELTKARKLLGGVGTSLKQGKYVPAAQSIHDSIVLMFKTGVMKSEREEFGQLFEKAVYALNNSPEFRQIYPLIINYSPGEEKALLATMNDVLATLQDHINEGAQKDMAKMAAEKAEETSRGQALLDAENYDEARAVFHALLKRYSNDTDLKADIADRFLRAELYEDAFNLLEEALKDDPEAIALYNRIGIVLRRMGEFETAERYYKKALEISRTDEYLYFNLGRLYYDWHKWDKMLEAASHALAINAGFAEAKKMAQFARKKLA
ncbi:MAG: tetratricopeptide repeat protein [Desulfovibrionaceae bacterium]